MRFWKKRGEQRWSEGGPSHKRSLSFPSCSSWGWFFPLQQLSSFFVLWGSTLSSFVIKMQVPSGPTGGHHVGPMLTHCCWEHGFGPFGHIVWRYQEPWKRSHPATQQSHSKKYKEVDIRSKLCFTKAFITALHTRWNRRDASINKRKTMASTMWCTPN